MRQLLFWREALWLYHRDAANDRHTFGFKDAYGYKEAYDYKEADYDTENTDHISENPHFLFGRLDLKGDTTRSTTTSVKTGDDSPVELYTVMASAALIIIVWMMKKKAW